MEVERTFALIKPDAVRAGKAEEIKQLVEIHGFTIIAQQKIQLTKARAEEFYGEHLGKAFFPRLIEFMTSGPVWAMVLAKVDAITGWRGLMGPTNAFVAREQAPRSLRALYGTDGTQNATHGSDSPTSAAREIKFYFPSLVNEPLLDPAAASVYISTRIQPALSKALTALAREKPSAEKFEAITFLADFLLNNNPNKPKVVMPDAWDPSVEHEDDDEEFAHAQLHALEQAELAAQAAAADAAAAAAAEVAAAEAVAQAAVVEAAARAAEAEAAAQAAAEAAAAAAVPPAPLAHEVVSQSSPAPSMPSTPPAAAHEEGAAPTTPLADDEALMNAAATKVQATFRGYQARKEVADMRSGGQTDADLPPATDSLLLAPSRPATTVTVPAGISNREGMLRAMFTQLDLDGSGAIDKSELKAALSAMGKLHGSELAEQLDAHMATMDANSDNLVSLDEFLTHMTWVSSRTEDDVEFARFLHDSYNVSVQTAVDEATGAGVISATAGFGNREAVLQAAFSRLDRDGSGFIDKEEFKAALAKLSELRDGQLNDQAAHEIDAMDANGDSKVSLDEFVEHVGWISNVLSTEEFYQYLENAFKVRVPGHQAPAPAVADQEEELPDLASFTPEQEAAVTKIQAAGRGMVARKRVAAMKADAQGETALPGATPEEEALPPEATSQEEAAPPEATPEEKAVPAEATPEEEAAPPEATPEEETAPAEATPEEEAAPPEATPEEEAAPDDATPEEEAAPPEATPQEEATPAEATPEEEATPDDATPEEEALPPEATPEEEATPDDATPQSEATPAEATPEEEAAPPEATPEEEATPDDATPEEEATPDDATPEEEAVPPEATPEEEATPDDATPQSEATPAEATPEEEAAPPEATPEEEAVPAEATPEEEAAPPEATPEEEATPAEATPEEEATPDEATPEEEAAPPEATPEEKAVPAEATPEEEAAPPEATPEEEATPDDATPEEEAAPAEATPEEEATPDEATPEEEAAPPEATPEEEAAPPEATPEEEATTPEAAIAEREEEGGQ